jgi:hypothetical protein
VPKDRGYVKLPPGPIVNECYKPLIYDYLQLARLFVPGKPFQPSLMFFSKAKACLSEAHFRCPTLG